jgi:DNA-directed RNA polymerase delta subunit
LESIGKEYGITRERVRQIEVQAKKLIARRMDVLQEVAQLLKDVFHVHGGILCDEQLIEAISNDKDNLVGPHWVHADQDSKNVDYVIDQAEEILAKQKHPKAEDGLISKIRQRDSLNEEQLPNEHIIALLRASKSVKENVFGEWGLDSWVETSPRGVGDKAYIVLRRFGKPEHFRSITDLINDAKFDHKRAHAQTVHNELIKDERFVLVGRGLYGLTEWGYLPGTVADVLEAILNEATKPLTREELLEKVLKQRMVKKTTVLLGLQNSDRFQKVVGGRYKLTENK